MCADVSAEDIGNYTCEVHGPHNMLLASVTHRVFVAGPHSLSASYMSTALGAVSSQTQSKQGACERCVACDACVAFGWKPRFTRPPTLFILYFAVLFGCDLIAIV